jgi:predicted AAA+ superfamily ATPase
MYIRKQIFNGIENESAFLWGARQTGKSTLLKKLYPDSDYFDLLLSDEYNRFIRNPSLLREICEARGLSKPVIIDEIESQKNITFRWEPAWWKGT